jgi:type IV pilus assembly protein PilN
MIRINLLAVDRKPRRTFDLKQKVPLACSLILIATAIAIGWRFWSLRQQSVRLDADIVAARQEAESLQSVLKQVEDFERRKGQLQQRVALIEDLRRDQTGPVRLLDELSRALPDRLWLTELKQENAQVRIDGRTTSLTALSDFVGNLEGSGYFARPVEILDSRVETLQGTGDVVRFSVKAQFVMPGGQQP